jgi:gas vesicle protein
VIAPIVNGAAVAAEVTYLFVTEHGKQLRGQMAKTANKGWKDFQEKSRLPLKILLLLKIKFHHW